MEAIIRYGDKKDLERIMAFGERNGFPVTDTEKGEEDGEDEAAWPTKVSYVNGIPLIKRDPNITIDDMAGAFSDIGLDVEELRRNILRNRA